MPRNGSELATPIGAVLKEARQIRGKTQQQVATAVEVARISYLQWEQDQTHPTPRNLKKVCAFLDVDVEGILAGEVRTRRALPETSAEQGFDDLFALLIETARREIGFAPDREQAIRWLATRSGFGNLLR